MNIQLTNIISNAFDQVPTFIENDGNLAALAEYQFGAAQGCSPALYLTLSTGIGGGLVIDGKLFTGWSGLAIEPGHMRFTMPNGEVRRLEELASGTGIGRMAQAVLSTGNQSTLLAHAHHIDGEAVGSAAQNGDELALEIIHEAATWLGLGLVNLLHLFSPQVIVLGGSVTKLGNLILKPAKDILNTHILDQSFIPPDLIRLAQLGDDVCLVGAAVHATNQLTA